nr:MAG TPA: hypothetical protein [Caudoviricetes sp.]
MGRYDDEVYKIIRENNDLTYSKDDIALGKDNINAFKEITAAKKDWLNSTTTAGQKAANDRANAVRQTYGNYTGGVDGLNGTYKAPSPTFDDYNERYNNNYTFNKNDYYDSLINAYDGEKPTYSSSYQDTIDGLLDEILNTGKFEYNMNADPLYQQYRDQYIREGQRAMRDTQGAAAAATGGYGSSYSNIAGQQAYDTYLSQLNDRVPELEQYAYGKYRDDIAELYNQLGAAQSLEEYAYNQYLNDLNQYNYDRNYYTDAAAQAQAEQDNWNNFLLNVYGTELGQFNTDREWNNALETQEYNKTQNQLAQKLEYAANMGDYDTISNLLGIDTSTAKTLMDQSIKSGELSLTSQELANAAQQMSNQMSSLELGDYINSRSVSGSSGGSGGGSSSRSTSGSSSSGSGDAKNTNDDYKKTEQNTNNSSSYNPIQPLAGITNSAANTNLNSALGQAMANSMLDNAAEKFETEEAFDNYVATLINQGKITKSQYNAWLKNQ